jgi:prevent-host-death family protein
MYQVYREYHADMDATRMGTRELRDNLGHRIDAAHFRGEPTVITHNGEPRAVLIPYAAWAQGDREDKGK